MNLDHKDQLVHLDHKEKEVRVVFKENQVSRAHKVMLDYQERMDVLVTLDEQDLQASPE